MSYKLKKKERNKKNVHMEKKYILKWYFSPKLFKTLTTITILKIK